MKSLYIFGALFLSLFLSLQARAFNYTASVIRPDGSVAANEKVEVVFTLVDGNGQTLFSESHSGITTDAQGFIEANIGDGQTTAGSFDNIPWNDPNLSASVVITLENGTEIKDTLPLATVPHAFGADSADALVAFHGSDKFTLAVDDSGNLSTVKSSAEIIPIPEGYTRMIFHDEFDVDGMPDPTFWGYEEGYVRGGEMQYYTVARPENAYVKDGLLHIVTLNDNWEDADGKTHTVTSASVTTKDKVKFTYGRVDIRAKLPICLGSWPALWMMPNDDVYGYWPNSGEIDIIEHVGFNPYNIYFTAHCAEQNGDNNKYHGSTSVPDCTTAFHVYSLEWSENRLDWYIDGRRKWTVVKNSNTWRGWPFNKVFYLIMNTAFGGSWGGQKGVDLEALPITFEIDYVRVFQ